MLSLDEVSKGTNLYGISKRILIVASAITIMMAVPHFFVPFVFPWDKLVEGLYPPVRWALFAMNFFFSLLLFWGGLLSLTAALKWNMTRGMRYWIFGGVGLFWIIGAVYEIIFPFPIVEAQLALPIVALINAGLYGTGLLTSRGMKDAKR